MPVCVLCPLVFARRGDGVSRRWRIRGQSSVGSRLRSGLGRKLGGTRGHARAPTRVFRDPTHERTPSTPHAIDINHHTLHSADAPAPLALPGARQEVLGVRLGEEGRRSGHVPEGQDERRLRIGGVQPRRARAVEDRRVVVGRAPDLQGSIRHSVSNMPRRRRRASLRRRLVHQPPRRQRRLSRPVETGNAADGVAAMPPRGMPAQPSHDTAATRLFCA